MSGIFKVDKPEHAPNRETLPLTPSCAHTIESEDEDSYPLLLIG